jgi:hypothetical protein
LGAQKRVETLNYPNFEFLLLAFSLTTLPLPSFHKNRGMVTTVEVETKFRVSKTKTQ